VDNILLNPDEVIGIDFVSGSGGFNSLIDNILFDTIQLNTTP
jgi:hypothetical protein